MSFVLKTIGEDWKQEFFPTQTTGQEKHLWGWTSFSRKFPPGPKRSIYVSTEISGNFGIMESTLGLKSEVRTVTLFSFLFPLNPYDELHFFHTVFILALNT